VDRIAVEGMIDVAQGDSIVDLKGRLVAVDELVYKIIKWC
jgi:hypothetical protein